MLVTTVPRRTNLLTCAGHLNIAFIPFVINIKVSTIDVLGFMHRNSPVNRDNYDNESRETNYIPRSQKGDYLKAKLSEIQTNNKNENIRDLHTGI